MATTPDFKPLFNRVQQVDRHDDIFAVIAMLGGTTLDNIRQQAEVFGLPQVGPYYPYIDGDLIAKLLTSRGLVGTVWKESKPGRHTLRPGRWWCCLLRVPSLAV